MQPGDKVRVKGNPSRIGILTSDPPRGQGVRKRLVVCFPDGAEQLLEASLEKVTVEYQDSYLCMQSGRYAGASHLRGAITQARLSGKLANLIYSLNTTNTKFYPYQFKPVLQYLDSPSRGLIIADEVGLGKTIEAGLIWTELRARQDAGRLLVVCPAMLREKWCDELSQRFGVKARIVDAAGLLEALQNIEKNSQEELALVVSMQGMRPPSNWRNSSIATSAAAKLARYLDEQAEEEPLLDLVVVDEAHYLRNKDTQTHRFAKLLRPVTDGLLLLSATPIQLRSTDLFNLLHLLDQDTFALEWIYDHSVKANAPIVALRDKLQRQLVTRDEFKAGLEESIKLRSSDDNEQISYLLENLPDDEVLASYRGRAEYAELLDRINPRAKVITRTLKRDVHELRVQRVPITLSVVMTNAEKIFYQQITDAVRKFCEENNSPEGFLLTIPQRQMSSCMAGAYMSWMMQAEPEFSKLDEEFAVELVDLTSEMENSDKWPDAAVELRRRLKAIARHVGRDGVLERSDSKFDKFFESLAAYWRSYPGKKVVLFAFYRNTLKYLHKRLEEHGVRSVVLHGGKDKQAVLSEFREQDGPQILLSSEVASEGVDLQFSSLLVNYDLPWNPAKIEQRIGRIDRIGQEADKILIWNLVYQDTLDDRVYRRLLERLNVFRSTLGAMEETLGAEVRELTRDLLTHRLTPEEEEKRIEESALAVEKIRLDQEELDARSMELLGHGDFIQNKAKAAHELGRYIRGDDLYHYVKDYVEAEFPGSRLVVSEDEIRKGALKLSIEAKAEFHAFLYNSQLFGRTNLLSDNPPVLWFDNQHGNVSRGVEKITQDHPLVRFVADRQEKNTQKAAYFPTSAVSLASEKAHGVEPGTYVYAVFRWTFSGPRDIEKLVYEVRSVETGCELSEELAEQLIHAAALDGVDWHASAANVLDHVLMADLQDECRAALEDRFNASTASQQRENRDRIREMNAALDKEYKRKMDAYEERVERLQHSNDPNKRKVLPMERGKLKKLEEKIAIQKQQNRLKIDINPRSKDVSSGVIVVM